MPELPEVETIRTCLADRVTGRTVKNVYVKQGSRLLRDTVSPASFKKKLKGEKIVSLDRRGKYLIIRMSGGLSLVVHLGMTGVLYALQPKEKRPDHTHVVLELDDADLVLSDPRTFGRVMIMEDGEELAPLKQLGPEPLGVDFNTTYLSGFLDNRKAPVKSLLLGQKAVAGIGNIYADEACFRAGILPSRLGGSLTPEESDSLVKSIKSVIKESIRMKGCTIRDYRWDAGKSGSFARSLKVYGREGGPCTECGSTVDRVVISGRSTFFCPRCQT